MNNERYFIRFSVPGAYGQYRGNLDSAERALNDYQALTKNNGITDVHIFLRKGKHTKEISKKELEEIVRKENPQSVLIS